jgi:hypothetical protein
MKSKTVRIHCVGDVLTSFLSRIASAILELNISVEHYDINQHFQVLLSDISPEVLISYTTAGFFFAEGDLAAAEAGAQDYCVAIKAFAARRNTLVVVNTILPPLDPVVGVTHMAQRRAFARINDMLFACADESPMVRALSMSLQSSRGSEPTERLIAKTNLSCACPIRAM